jgi:hypothetical protein
MSKIITFLTFFLLITSCNEGKTGCQLERGETSLTIPADIPLLQRYAIASERVKDGRFAGFIGYNNANHSIDIFSTSGLETMIKLSLDGPGSIDEIRGVREISKNRLLLISRNRIVISDKDGKFEVNINISTSGGNSTTGTDHGEYHPNIKPHTGLDFFFDEISNDLYLPLNNFSYPEWISPEVYQEDKKVVGKINIITGKFDFLDISYPDFLAENLYATLSEINTSFDDKGNIIYGFDVTPDIFVYNTTTKETSHIANREGFEMPSPIINVDDIYGYTKDKVRFYRILFNTIDKKLYQIVMRPHPEGGYDAHVRFFDDNFSFIAEEKIPQGLSVKSLLFSDKGIYCLDMTTEENIISYDNIYFKCE